MAFIATASLGAIWAACAPEFGARSVIDRFAQIEPKVLLAVGGYGFGAKDIDRRGEVEAIRAGLPTLEHVVDIPTATRCPTRRRWAELLAEPARSRVRAGAVRPPAVRAVLLGHHRQAEGDRPRPRRDPARAPEEPRPELGSQARDRLLWFSTTAWMMWNALVSALLVGRPSSCSTATRRARTWAGSGGWPRRPARR